MEFNTSVGQACIYAAVAGALSHWTYFIHGEHHTDAPRLLRLSLALPVLLFFGLWYSSDLDGVEAAKLTGQLVASFSASLWTSIVIYRIFFHRLRSFPGPFSMKVSKLSHVSKLAPRSDNFIQLDDLHNKFGDFVRTGPNEISVFHPEGVTAILGPGSKCTKAPWYDATLPFISLHTLRNKLVHDKRRRVWDRGFGAKALRTYEDRVSGYSKDLLRQISSRTDKPLNVAEWFHYYAFDVMGDIAFGKSFGMLTSGKSHYALDLLVEGMRPLGVLTPIPWAFCILSAIPGLGTGFKTFVKWAAQQVEERKKMHLDVPDVMSWLIDSAEKAQGKERKAEEDLLHNDSRLIIVAGSDTTSATLSYLFYNLAKETAHLETLRQELKPFQGPDGDFKVTDLVGLKHLNGVINETLRLHPPVPSGLLRVTPAEGITIGETFIPGNTTVVSPSYTIGRLESCFERASEFIPERWYAKPEMVKRKDAFAPFSLGPNSCVGKQLALMELRTVVAYLVTAFDVKFAPGEDGTRLLNDSKDFFTISTSDLEVIFTRRYVVS